ncbi:TetR/AcrR family transcriptional regulator [Marinobacter sp. JSM 1782161]|uniref:TetR/AcrR family transcriptional regulator n=1 Tax=Marinobacter sp. JSM 1782161 TaxID=2685906 RepID=UPI001401F5E4|nr:TetR/AcrR family transcriptional regulator [Marinobacter sp. JSM 1782161]
MIDTATLGKRERNRLNNQKAILDAARDCFREVGYEQTTIRDIIRRTDLAAGTFYNYFSDKRDIFIALFRDFLESLRTLVKQSQGAAQSEQELVHHTYRALFQAAAADPVTYDLAHRNDQAIRDLFGAGILDLATAALDRNICGAVSRDHSHGVESGYLTAACRGIAYEVSLKVAERCMTQPSLDAEREADSAADFVRDLILGNSGNTSVTLLKRA